MKFKKIMRMYYRNKLNQIEEMNPRFKITEKQTNYIQRTLPQKWEDALGIGITVCYLLQFFLPGNWFSIGRCFSIFKIGF